MILDERSEFADATALSTAGTGRALVGDVIDLGAQQRDVGNGEPLFLVIQVTTAPTSAGAPGIVFELASDAQAAIATDGTATVHYASKSYTMAQLPVGTYAVVVPLPVEGPLYERYLGILQNIATAALTGGAINAFLTKDAARWKAYDAPGQD